MGKPMVSNLLKAGFEVTIVPHINKTPAQALQAEGAKVVGTPKEVGAASDVIVTCLPNAPEVEEVLFGENGVMAGAQPGIMIIDTSTITPGAAQQIAAKATEQGGKY